jgi:hypothetical protein
MRPVAVAESFRSRTQDPLHWLRKGIIAFVSVWAIIALISGHRAIWQVQKLELHVPEGTLRPGSLVAVETRSSGRVHVRVVLELVQGARSETLAMQRIEGSHPTFDPRWRRGEISHILTSETLQAFQPGAAIVRVTAHGASQWLRTPPPEVRERPVRLIRP